MTDLQADVRLWTYEQVMADGLVPGPLAIGRRFDLDPTEVESTLRALQDDHDALVLVPGTSLVWMAEPFSAVPTGFRVRSGADAWWGNCIWDALAVLALLDRDGTVETRCPGSGVGLTLTVSDGQLVPADHVVHFAVAARDWWRSIGFTWSTMLLFRSEEDLDAWTAETGIGRGAAFDLDGLWALARTWYDDRLDRDWRRRSATERQSLLEAAGLTGDFWAIEPPT